ncbi:MAG: hypothetical protein JOZ96_06905 [Acidobacteria bacterium]|nr:hypothetical protein [Acidobacteriota bacterium]
MHWFHLGAFFAIFVTSCVGLGHLAESWVLRRGWRAWASGLLSAAVVLVWPVGVVAYFMYDASRYQAEHPGDDAPGMVIFAMVTVGFPLLALLGIVPVRLGAFLARRRHRRLSLR